MSQKIIKITSGPSREELFDGLRLTGEKREVRFFIVNDGEELVPSTWIRSIEAEDGSGQSWNIKFTTALSLVGERPVDYTKQSYGQLITVKAYYSTKSRTGTISIE